MFGPGRPENTQQDMILLLASMGVDFVLPLLDMRCSAAEAVLPGCSSRGCPPRMQQQSVTAEVFCSRGCPPRMQRLSSQDAATEAVLPGCSRVSQQRLLIW
ncbi:hypothetical protein F7725_025653 [Dissostichus mawsoni]|uniref:Uncharacterized protein n=1 Tax=Dissostichus mawsoni TaxID=36200 RepID=A0A7J5XCP0_DISMA|nr:hypothetical protein F7725_025653 [Dissostichus mawsoni]